MKKNYSTTPKPLQHGYQNVESLERVFQSADALQRETYYQNMELKQQISQIKQYLETMGIQPKQQQYGNILHQLRASKLHLAKKTEELAEVYRAVALEEQELEYLNRQVAAKSEELQFNDDPEICEMQRRVREVYDYLNQVKREDSEYSSECARCIQENVELSRQKVDLEVENSQLMQRSREIFEELQEASSKLTRFQYQKDSVEQRIQTAKSELERVKRSNLSYLRQMDALVKGSIYQYNRIYQAYAVLKQRLKLIEQDLYHGYADIAHKQKQTGHLHEIIAECETSNNALKTQLAYQIMLSNHMEEQFHEINDLMRHFCTQFVGDCRQLTLEEVAEKTLQVLLARPAADQPGDEYK